MLVSKKKQGVYVFDIQPRPSDNDKSKLKSCMLRINNPKKTYWELFVILLAIFNAFAIPIEIAFAPPELETGFWTFINTMIDCVFLADIFV
jgi:hypothetical protein